MSKLDKALDKLRESYGLALPDVRVSGAIDLLTLDSPNLNYVFGGGYPKGRIVTLQGPESGGKTALANYIGGQIQKQKDFPNVVAFVDMEHTFLEKYANVVGLDTSPDKFIFIRPKHGEEGFEIIRDLVETGEIGMFIWDSVASTPSAKALGKEVGSATFGGTAAVMAEGLKVVNPLLSRYGVSTIFINQVRAKIGGMPGFGPQENTKVGGYSLPFYSSWIARISSLEDVIDSKTVIGKGIKVKNTKSKVGIPKRSVSLDLNFTTGFNPDMEYLSFIVNLGYIQKSARGGWYTSDELGLKVQGDSGLLNWLKERPSTFDELKLKINNSFKNTTILDNPIDEEDEEDAVDAIFSEMAEE